MQRNQAAQERNRSVFINFTVVIVFVSLMLGFILYFADNSPDIRKIALQNMANQFATSASNAHWQWQGEGRPDIVILISYAGNFNKRQELIETGRRPIFMGELGWPKAEQSSKGCEQLWNMVLNIPLDVEGFKIYSEYFDGTRLSGNALDSTCRYRLSTGPYFEYKIFSGQVSKVMS
ncbi:MAG: hypothetical protein ACI88A_002390 [Paraglaciecola sp.]|jgi:hypothetical protein